MMPATAEEEHDCRLELSLHSYDTATLTTLGGGAESDGPDHASKIQNDLQMISLSWHHHHHHNHTHRHSPTLSSSLYANAKSKAANDEKDVAGQNSDSDKPQIRFHDYLSAAAGAGAGTGGDGDGAGSLYRWISAGAGERQPVGVGSSIWFNHNSASKPQAQAQARARAQVQAQSQSPEIHVMDLNFAASASVASSSSCRNIVRFCVDCKTSKTPLWRSGPQGPKSLCNACGIRYRKARRALAALGDSHSHSHTTTASSSVTKRKSHSAEAKLQHNKRSKIVLPESWRSSPTSWRKINKSPLLLGDKETQVDGSNPSAAAARFKRVFARDEDEEAAVLLMAMSCGRLVHV